MPRNATNSRAAIMPVKVERAVDFTVSPASPRAIPAPRAIGNMNHPIGRLGRGPKLYAVKSSVEGPTKEFEGLVLAVPVRSRRTDMTRTVASSPAQISPTMRIRRIDLIDD